jgi:hypothetical protein
MKQRHFATRKLFIYTLLVKLRQLWPLILWHESLYHPSIHLCTHVISFGLLPVDSTGKFDLYVNVQMQVSDTSRSDGEATSRPLWHP